MSKIIYRGAPLVEHVAPNKAYDRVAFLADKYPKLEEMYQTIMEHLKMPSEESSSVKIIKNVQTMPVARILLDSSLGYDLDDSEERDLLSQNIVTRAYWYLSGEHTIHDYYKFYSRWAYISKEHLVVSNENSPIGYFLIVPIPTTLYDGVYATTDNASVSLRLAKKDHSEINMTSISAGFTYNLRGTTIYRGDSEHEIEERAIYMGD